MGIVYGVGVCVDVCGVVCVVGSCLFLMGIDYCVMLYSGCVGCCNFGRMYIYISLFAHTSYKVVHRKCNCIQTEYIKR